MPLYVCVAEKGAIPESAKGAIAREVTRVHCELTGAPTTFVHCFFFDRGSEQAAQLSHVYSAGGERPYALFGNLRAGRSEELKDQVVEQMCAGVADILGVPRDAIEMATRDIPAKWVMEGGDLLPEPGEEAEWLAAHDAKLAASDTGDN